MKEQGAEKAKEESKVRIAISSVSVSDLGELSGKAVKLKVEVDVLGAGDVDVTDALGADEDPARLRIKPVKVGEFAVNAHQLCQVVEIFPG